MISKDRPSGERCGARAEHFRVTCDLDKGHVKTIDDWHQGTATNFTKQLTETHSFESSCTETARWQPNQFEVPRAGRDPEPLDEP